MTAGQHRPQRSCVGCRQAFEQPQLVRYVRSPEGSVLVDYRNKLPGRGAYTCLNAECIRQAVSRKQFDRAFRAACQPRTAEALVAEVAGALHDHMAALLGMARKSSQLVSGGNLVLDALDRPERLAVVIVAGDTSPGVAEKIERKAGSRQVPLLRFASKSDLGQLLGRGERSVTALLKGRLADAFLTEWRKFKEISGER